MRAAAALTALSCLLLAGCGGSDESEPSTEPGGGCDARGALAACPATTSRSFREPRTTSPATSASRSSSSMPRARSSRFRPRASGSRTPSTSAPFLEDEAKLERIGIPGGDEADATHIYVATLRLPRAGKYWFARGARGRRREGAGARERRRGREGRRHLTSATRRSPPTRRRSPRPEETRRALTTRTPPDESLLRYSVADSLERKGAVRRDVRDAEVLLEPDLRAGRRRRRGGVATASRARTSASSTSRCSRTTTRRRASTAGCRSGTCRPSRGRSSSAQTGRSQRASRGRSP